MSQKNYLVITACNEFNDPNATLKGCCNDGRAAFEMCRDNFNTVGWDWTILFNNRNTADRARSEIQSAISAANPGDNVYVHNSSHGTIVPINGKSEHCNVPYDFDWSDLNTFVSGSQYQAMFRSAKPGVKIYFTTDSCNSGNMIGRALVNSVKNNTVRRNRFLHPPLDLSLMLTTCAKAHPKGIIGDLTDVWFLSGCGASATDYSADVSDPTNGESYGAFSHYLFPLLIANKGKSKSEICQMVDDALVADQFDQRPMAGGSDNGSFLGL